MRTPKGKNVSAGATMKAQVTHSARRILKRTKQSPNILNNARKYFTQIATNTSNNRKLPLLNKLLYIN